MAQATHAYNKKVRDQKVKMHTADMYKCTVVRPPTGLFYIERDPHSRTEIGERDIVLSAQE
jgi:hypothetical protein